MWGEKITKLVKFKFGGEVPIEEREKYSLAKFADFIYGCITRGNEPRLLC